MKKLIYILFTSALLASCKSPRNVQSDIHVDYSDQLNQLSKAFQSLSFDFNKQTNTMSDLKSNVNVETNAKSYYPPDSTGKQALMSESNTKTKREDHQTTNTEERTDAALQQLSVRIDDISNKLDAILNKKEKVVEVTWWQLHKDKVYGSIILISLIIIGWLVYRIRKK